MANGEVLDLLEEKIAAALKVRRIKASDKTMLEVMQLFVIYMKDDHPKTQTMWIVFRPAVWIGTAFILSFIGAIASGNVTITIAP
jgi:hypothetical protein